MSRIIKSNSAFKESKEQLKVIELRQVFRGIPSESETTDKQSYFLEREKERMIAIAKREAEELLASAAQEAEHLKMGLDEEKAKFEQEKSSWLEQAKNEGFEAGFQTGQEAGYQQYKELLAAAKRTTDLSKVEFSQYLDSAENVILELGMKAAEKILNDVIAGHPERFLPIVKRALKEVREYSEIQIHVHPFQYDFLISQKEELESVFPKNTQVFIYPDEDLGEMNCFIESPNGRVDASIDSQLIELKGRLLSILEGDSV
ncbi:flagellar assembly protein FliH [Falsibacillus albus]|uniref:flagellar assembly protein FliH n=1 Tax=Falsibacillus albus TaxID=2478915 RepID=UPI001314952D|nr:flagellar assembly protein FliH [Falsibacillus albus]